MAKKPLISVIIPTYNRDQMVGQAIESVLEQEFKDFELIVVDDGSTDDTPDILSAYGNDILVHRQINKGVSAARNKGIQLSLGRFIAFLDSDDLWMPQKLSQQIAFFKSKKDAMICQTEEIWMRDGVRVNPGRRHKKKSGMIFKPSLALCLVSPSAVMINKDLFDVVGFFDETLPACEDYDLWLRTSCRFPIYLIDKPLIIKRGGHRDQLSKTPGLDKYRIEAIKKVMESGLLSTEQYLAAARTIKEKCIIYAQGCKKRGRFEEADHYNYLALFHSKKFDHQTV